MRHSLACFIIVPATLPAFGQTNQTATEKLPAGSIQGNLTTPQGEATGLAGITMKLSPEAPDGTAVTADTDDAGHYEFNNLKPGSYSIFISQQGFKKFAKPVNVNPGPATILNIKLEIETIAEQVEVKEDTQAIATEATSTPTETVTQNEMVALPTAQQKIREVLQVTPGVVKTQDG